MKIFALLVSFYILGEASGQDQKVIYQYKKYERFDLGSLEVKGQLIAPGDLSVRERDRKRFELDLYSRKDFNTFVKKDIESFR